MRSVALVLSVILVFIFPWENAVTLPGLGTIGRLYGLLVAAFWIGTVVVTGKIRKPNLFHLLMFLFVFWNLLTLFWSVSFENTLIRAITYIQQVVLVYLMWDLYISPRALKAGMQAYILGAWISIYSIVSNYLANATFGTTARFTGSGFNANALALLLTLGMPLAWQLAFAPKEEKVVRYFRFINLAYVPAAFAGILLTASRGGIIATAPFLFFMFSTFTRLSLVLRIIIAVTLILAALAIQPLIPEYTYSRLATTGDSISSGDFGERGHIWREGFELLAQNPLIGVGSNAYQEAVPSKIVAHNTYLSILVESGLVGFILFMGLLAVVFYCAYNNPNKWESLMWLTVLLIWAISVFAFAWEYRKATWLFLGFIVIAANVSKQNKPIDTVKGEDRLLNLSEAT